MPTLIENGSSTPLDPVAVGGSHDRIFTLSNPGDQRLQISSAVLSGPDATLLTNLNGVTIVPGGSMQFTIRFEPADSGEKSSVLTIVNNVAGGSFVATFTWEATSSGCVYAPPAVMAPSDTALFLNATALAGHLDESGGSSDRTNTAPIACAMSADGRYVAVGTFEDFIGDKLPKILVRNGATLDAFELTWPADYVPATSNLAYFFFISRTGAILAAYSQTPPDSFSDIGVYWENYLAAPVVVAPFAEQLSFLSLEGAWASLYKQETDTGELAYRKTPTGPEIVIGAETVFNSFQLRAANLCDTVFLSNWAHKFTRTPGTDTWALAETNEDHFLFDLSADGLVAVGNDYGNAGLIFQGGQITVPSVTITQIAGVTKNEIFCTRCSGTGSIVTGHYLNSPGVQLAFIWSQASGARSLNSVIDANGIDRGGASVTDVLWLSDNGKIMLVRATREYDSDNMFYVVLPNPEA